MYLTYEEYQNMGGTLDEATFNDYEFEAESLVNWYTFNRLMGETEYPESLKRCIYSLIKILQLKADTLGTAGTSEEQSAVTNIASQSNDGVSISYNTVPASQLVELSKSEMKDTIQRYLNGVVNSLGHKVLYRGLYPGE